MPTRLAAARAARGWTQGQLLCAMRVRARLDGHELPDGPTLRVMLSRWENGHHHPAPFYRRLIAEALDMTEADLGFPLPSPGRSAACVPGPPARPHPAGIAPAIHDLLVRAQPAPGVDTSERQPSLSAFEARILDAASARPHRATGDASLVLVGGFAGSGKTEFGQLLAAITGWALLDKDALTRPLTESLLLALGADPNDRETDIYKQRVRPLEYRCLLNTAFDNLDNRVSTVLTAPFLQEMPDLSWLRRVAHHCTAEAIDVAVVWVHCDVDSMYAYLQGRGAARDGWKLTHWDNYLRSIDLGLRPRCPHLEVDNGENAAVGLAAQAQRFVSLVRHEA
jgi:transcriptional regulator with XRE-family HTH domain/predicted kinase